MIERIACRCEECDRKLTDERRALTVEGTGAFATPTSVRGAMTITVARE
ncbi:hypothetical protein [Halalkalicoccus subterraneus]|nr:hypothetical protein [Halalkalicoccus subterraneus]